MKPSYNPDDPEMNASDGFTSPKGNRDLVDFLRTHRLQPPPASPDLEQQILQAIALAPNPTPAAQRNRYRPLVRMLSVGVPTAIAAGLVCLWVGPQFSPTVTSVDSATEMAQLEGFMQTNWEDLVGTSDLDADSSLAATQHGLLVEFDSLLD